MLTLSHEQLQALSTDIVVDPNPGTENMSVLWVGGGVSGDGGRMVEGLKAQMVKICKYPDDGVLQFKSVSIKLNVVVRDNGTCVQV